MISLGDEIAAALRAAWPYIILGNLVRVVTHIGAQPAKEPKAEHKTCAVIGLSYQPGQVMRRKVVLEAIALKEHRLGDGYGRLVEDRIIVIHPSNKPYSKILR